MSRQLSRLRYSLPSLCQGGTLSIRSSFPEKVRVNIVSEWRTDGHVCLAQGSGPSAHAIVAQEKDKLTSMGRLESHVSVHVTSNNDQNSKDNGSVTLSNNSDDSPVFEELTLTATVPEKVNINCDLPNGGDISFEKKIEGNVHVTTSDGSIKVSKLRGHDVSLSGLAPRNVIFVSDVLEAKNLHLSTPGRVRAQRILGENIRIDVVGQTEHQDVTCGDAIGDTVLSRNMDDDDGGAVVDISSLYTSGDGGARLVVMPSQATLDSYSTARVKSNHGHISVLTSTRRKKDANVPVVDLGGVNGSCDVSIKLEGTEVGDSSTSGRVHFDSLSPGSVSAVTTNHGDVSISLDQTVATDVRLASSPNIAAIDVRETFVEADNLADISNALHELQGPIDSEPNPSPTEQASKIVIRTNSISKRPQLCCSLADSHGILEYVDGWVEDVGMDSVHNGDKDHGRGGKIRLDDASAQALYGFSNSRQDDAMKDADRPLILVGTNASISMDVMTWRSSIARRFSL